jgi:rhamnosyltransferase
MTRISRMGDIRQDAYRIAAYITAYEDAEALNACLNALQCQSYPIEQVLVVDNSRQPLVLDPDCVQNLAIQVLHYPENIGIAAGINSAVERFWSQGYTFLWMFDQDSQPAPDCLELLLKTYDQVATTDYPIGILGPQAIDARTGETVEPGVFLGDHFQGYKAPSLTEPFECDAPITSGSLLWLTSRAQVAPPDPKLFIDGVDLDYGLRLRRAGFHNLIAPLATMQHRFGDPIAIQLAGKKKIFQIYSPLRHYYICRNHTHLELTYSQGLNRITCGLRRIKYVTTTLIVIGLFDPKSKPQKMAACIRGTYHGFRGNLDGFWR